MGSTYQPGEFVIFMHKPCVVTAVNKTKVFFKPLYPTYCGPMCHALPLGDAADEHLTKDRDGTFAAIAMSVIHSARSFVEATSQEDLFKLLEAADLYHLDSGGEQ